METLLGSRVMGRVPMVLMPRLDIVGQRDHDGSKCTTDLSKQPCFKYHEFGHISTNCRGDAENSKGSGKPSDGRKSDGKDLLHPPKVVSPRVRGLEGEDVCCF